MDGALVFERASATPPTKGSKLGAKPAPSAVRRSEVACLSLADQQWWFQTVITHPENIEAGAALAGEPVERVISAGPSISAVEGLEVYHYAYRARLIECLVDDYPTLNYALGADAFAELATRYIARHPSRSRNLNSFGRYMEAFCREQDGPRAPFWVDSARLEWALVEVLHAEDSLPLVAEELACVPADAWTGARLLPSDTLRVCRFKYPVNEFFQAFKNYERPSVPEPASHALAVYRQGFTLWRTVLTPEMADLLEDLVSGATLGDALSVMGARAQDPGALAEAARNVMEWFSSWVRAGFFRSLELDDRGS